MSLNIFFSKNKTGDNYENMDQTNKQPAPPSYEEARNSTSPSLSIVNPTAAALALGTDAAVVTLAPAASVEQVQQELSALSRAQIHLYKRMQHVKSQTYASLVLIFVTVTMVLIFTATTLTPSQLSSNDDNSGKGGSRAGKALSASLVTSVESEIAHNSLLDTSNDATNQFQQIMAKQVSNDQDLAGQNKATLLGEISYQATKVESLNLAPKTNDAPIDDPIKQSGNVIHATVTFVPPELIDSLNERVDTNKVDVRGEETGTTTEDQDLAEMSTLRPSASIIIGGEQFGAADTYNISLLIHSATVPNMDYMLLGRASDTYCDLYIDGIRVGSTTIIDNNNQPNWQFLFPKKFTVTKESTIRIDLIDLDHLKKDHIGGVVVKFGDLLTTNRLNRPIQLFHGQGNIWVTIKLADH